jgi:Cu2+-containing amine oxidase
LRNPVAYPLDPVSGDEVSAVASILRREHGLGEGWRFASIELAEPGKGEPPKFGDGGPPTPRRFFDRNPSLDVVATPPDMCHTSTTSAHH